MTAALWVLVVIGALHLLVDFMRLTFMWAATRADLEDLRKRARQ